MHGFYSNLFTKNIAFGGDVKTSATSAYTAGSQRHIQNLATDTPTDTSHDDLDLVAEETILPTRDHHSSEEDESGSTLKEITTTENRSGGQQVSHAVTTSSSSSSPVTLKRPISDISVSGDPPPSVPAVSKSEVILSAKERYLARKNKTNNS